MLAQDECAGTDNIKTVAMGYNAEAGDNGCNLRTTVSV